MKNFLKKHWAFIGWLLTVILDKSTGLVERLVPDSFWQNFIYIIGTAMLGYFWTSSYNVGIAKDILQKK
jgi:hypothetical protein